MTGPPSSVTITFSDLTRAAYCPRQLWYARRDDDRGPPEDVAERRELAFRYPELRTAPDRVLADLPIDPDPDAYRRALDRLADRPDWAALSDPDDRGVRLAGKDCHGVAHKLLGGDSPIPSVISPGTPPERGVWEPQAVRAVATAKALSWERERSIPRALVEYPTVGVVRTVRLTTRHKAAYRRALRTVRELDGPPARRHDARCEGGAYRDQCGVRTRTLRSLLGV